ncbi:hypothetical protein U2F26_35270 [Micromonospora sp. 4G57]|uniref:Ricin B lectin domain-containing protein n=1 Tax=Micromonospora sicca TaxID=2202420 RepID=A0ABU5JPW9_9ACTN|nr:MULTISPECIES: hypothetical protein [unclassified Micromonospora]MDZ5447896.1 hypothetical protein [Micromonospora sp. 4G57]MDZ5494651.1 hypothetical protein [Micromonospora sp. 4G53]
MADRHDDLTAIVDRVRHVTTLPGAQTLRRRSDQRRRRRAAVTGAGLAVLIVTAGAILLPSRDAVETPDRGVVGPAGEVPPSVAPSVTASAGPLDILGGRRQVLIVVPGMGGAALAIGRDDDRVRATTEQGIDDRALWVLHPEGDKFRIMLAAPRSGSQVCMTVVHDAAPGSVRDRVCDPTTQTQLFKIEQIADRSYSILQDRRYLQVVDGTNALVPDLPEGLTTTYEFEDRGPAVTESSGGGSSPTR